MMASISTLFMELASNVVVQNQFAYISVNIGTDLTLVFDNRCQKMNDDMGRRILSPSQLKRNGVRKMEHLQRKLQSTTAEVQIKDDKVNVESQTDYVIIDNETQTLEVATVHVGTLTDQEELETFENSAGRNDETLIETRFDHSFTSWEEIENFINNNIKISLLEKPWLCCTGKQYMTVGFQTSKKDLEAWKLRTLNWREKGMREVASSRVYK